jgi:hypothetical protein
MIYPPLYILIIKYYVDFVNKKYNILLHFKNSWVYNAIIRLYKEEFIWQEKQLTVQMSAAG